MIEEICSFGPHHLVIVVREAGDSTTFWQSNYKLTRVPNLSPSPRLSISSHFLHRIFCPSSKSSRILAQFRRFFYQLLVSSPSVTMRTVPLFYAGCADFLLHEPHFLEACSLCRKPLGRNSDIFMYRSVQFIIAWRDAVFVEF